MKICVRQYFNETYVYNIQLTKWHSFCLIYRHEVQMNKYCFEKEKLKWKM